MTCRYAGQAVSSAVIGVKLLRRTDRSVSHGACVVTLLDRLIHHAEIITIEGDRCRLKEARERAPNAHGATSTGRRAPHSRTPNRHAEREPNISRLRCGFAMLAVRGAFAAHFDPLPHRNRRDC
jgi:hypothetical protein